MSSYYNTLWGEDPLEEEMATDSNILAWKILWTEDPGGLQSMGSPRVGHDRAQHSSSSSLFRLPKFLHTIKIQLK